MKVINVHIGEVRIARSGEILEAILGSCAGIGLIWRERNICGLAHCLLPKAPSHSYAIDGRFVTQAIPSLLALMKIKPEHYAEIEAVVTGGGNMTSPGAVESTRLVGVQNSQVAEQELKQRKIRIVHSDVGGEEGRRVSINSLDGSFRIERIPRITVAS